MEDRIPYETFGRRFFELAVTEERVVAGLGRLAGEPIEFGPIGAGPGKLARVSANGQVGEASVQRVPGDEIAFRLEIPVDLDLLIDLTVDTHRFDVAVVVELTLTARAAAPLRVVIDVEPPTRDHVKVEVGSDALRSSVFQKVAGVDREIGRFVAKYIARELDKPRIKAARDIDVAGRIDAGWHRALG